MIKKDIRVKSIHIPDTHKRLSTETGDIKKSIAKEGLRDPIIVVKAKKGYILADGFRRLQAWTKASIPAIVRECRSGDAEELASSIRVIVNHHRQGFYPSQRAHYLKLLADKYDVPLKEIAEACGVSERTLKERWMAVSTCSQEIKMLIDNGHWPLDISRDLATLKPAAQTRLVGKFRDRVRVSLTELREEVRRIRRRHPHLVSKPFRPRRVQKAVRRPRASILKGMDPSMIQKKISDREKEIEFMRREILHAKPIIKSILRRSRLRSELPSETLHQFEVFAKEEGL